MCLHMHTYVQCPLSLEEKVDPRELELQGCDPLEVGQETQLSTSAGTTNILNCSDISSAQYSPLHIQNIKE